MSFEGHYRLLCEVGHLDTCDVYDDYPDVCYARDNGVLCGRPFVWENTVDETNGKDEQLGYCPGDFPLEVEQEKLLETCAHCGHSKLISDERYKIPTGQGKGRKHDPKRYWG